VCLLKASDGLVVVTLRQNSVRITQSAAATCCLPLMTSSDDARDVILTTDEEYKLRCWVRDQDPESADSADKRPFKAVRTVLAPTFSGPVNQYVAVNLCPTCAD